MKKLQITTFAPDGQGLRARQIDGFDGANVLVRGERAESIATAIVERFSRQGAPRRPIGEGGCVRIDAKGVWLMNRADRGWASSSIHYDSWRDLLDDWAIQLDAPDLDEAGVYWPVRPLGEG